MKILFLDIDGVVNNYATMQRFGGFRGIDPKLAAIVQRIVKETGCSVVLSSTWRLDAKSRAHVRKMVCDFIGVTMDLPHAWRGEEVRHWLLDNVKQAELQAYAILDDTTDFNSDQPLFLTSERTGITDEIAEQVIAHLNKH